MEFKQNASQVFSSDLWYDITEGYIKPEELLEEKDAKKVREAVNLLTDFFDEAISLTIIELT